MGISCSVGVEAALHFYKGFLFRKMRFIFIASLILFLGIIGTNSAPPREARAAHDHDDYSDSEPEYEPEPEGSEPEGSKPEGSGPEPEGSGPEPEGSGPEPEGSDPEKEDSDTDSDPEAGYDVPKRV